MIEVSHETQLGDYLRQYGLRDSPDSFMVQGDGVILLKNYGNFAAETRRWREQLDNSI